MASYLAIAACLKPDDTHSSVLTLVADARDRGYDSVCLPLTTQKWRDRWTHMCLLPTGSDPHTDMAAERLAEPWRSNPNFQRQEVTITHLGQ